MLKTKILLGFLLLATVLVACEKKAPYDEVKQLEIDDAIIAKFLIDSNVTAIKHSSGLYYQIIKVGDSDVVYTPESEIKAKFRAKLLLDSVLYDKSIDSSFKFTLPGFMPGWQTGVQLSKPHGKIRLFIPSALGYQDRAVISPKIPANSILDITLEILSVNTKTK